MREVIHVLVLSILIFFGAAFVALGLTGCATQAHADDKDIRAKCIRECGRPLAATRQCVQNCEIYEAQKEVVDELKTLNKRLDEVLKRMEKN